MSEITIKTIAHEAGVSISLVSLVLNNRDVRVSEETRQRIKEVAYKYHYVPNSIASCLKLKETHTIALVAPFTPSGYFSNLVYHVQRFAQQAGYLTMVVNTFEDERQESNELELFRSGMFDGMLVAPLFSTTGNEVLSQMKEARFPFICVDRFKSSFDVPVVSSDHEKVGYDMTKLELRKGKNKIVFLYRNNSLNTSGQLRLSGYNRAMQEAGLEPKTYGFAYTEDKPSNRQEMRRIVETIAEDTDAVFIHSGYYLPLFIQACQDAEITFPQADYLMVDGFQFTEQAIDIARVFSAISGRCVIAVQDIEAIAKTAVGELLSRIEMGDDPVKQVAIPVRYQFF